VKRFAGLALLTALALLLTACPAPAPYPVRILYYPQEPSLCPEGSRLVTSRSSHSIVELVPATWPPTPPTPEEGIPWPPPEGVNMTYAEYFVKGGEPLEAHTSVLECRRGDEVLTTPGPKMPPVRGPAVTLIVVEDPSAPGYLRWYWAPLRTE
jgi:hypothetical protein